MNKSNRNTIIITVAVMLALFRMAMHFGWLSTHTNKLPTKQSQKANNQKKQATTSGIAHNNKEAEAMHLLDHPRTINYTKHAKCRMECRDFTKQEVEEILENGKINFSKSNDRPGDCPTYALEGITSDGQHARMVFALCSQTTAKVITVIDLDTDHDCNCY